LKPTKSRQHGIKLLTRIIWLKICKISLQLGEVDLKALRLLLIVRILAVMTMIGPAQASANLACANFFFSYPFVPFLSPVAPRELSPSGLKGKVVTVPTQRILGRVKARLIQLNILASKPFGNISVFGFADKEPITLNRIRESVLHFSETTGRKAAERLADFSVEVVAKLAEDFVGELESFDVTLLAAGPGQASFKVETNANGLVISEHKHIPGDQRVSVAMTKSLSGPPSWYKGENGNQVVAPMDHSLFFTDIIHGGTPGPFGRLTLVLTVTFKDLSYRGYYDP